MDRELRNVVIIVTIFWFLFLLYSMIPKYRQVYSLSANYSWCIDGNGCWNVPINTSYLGSVDSTADCWTNMSGSFCDKTIDRDWKVGHCYYFVV